MVVSSHLPNQAQTIYPTSEIESCKRTAADALPPRCCLFLLCVLLCVPGENRRQIILTVELDIPDARSSSRSAEPGRQASDRNTARRPPPSFCAAHYAGLMDPRDDTTAVSHGIMMSAGSTLHVSWRGGHIASKRVNSPNQNDHTHSRAQQTAPYYLYGT